MAGSEAILLKFFIQRILTETFQISIENPRKPHFFFFAPKFLGLYRISAATVRYFTFCLYRRSVSKFNRWRPAQPSNWMTGCLLDKFLAQKRRFPLQGKKFPAL